MECTLESVLAFVAILGKRQNAVSPPEPSLFVKQFGSVHFSVVED